MEKTDFPARCSSWWGLLGLRHLAMCWIFRCWLALHGDLPRSVSRFGGADVCGADVCAVSCEIRLWGSRQLRRQPAPAFRHLPGRAARSARSARWRGEEDEGIGWGSCVLGRCLLWALMCLQRGSGDLGAQCYGQATPSHPRGAGRAERPRRGIRN